MGVSLGCAIYANRDNILRFLRLEVPFGLVNAEDAVQAEGQWGHMSPREGTGLLLVYFRERGHLSPTLGDICPQCPFGTSARPPCTPRC